MKYCDYTHSRWEIIALRHNDTIALCVDHEFYFTKQDLVDNLNECLNKVLNFYDQGVEPEELEELVGYVKDFLTDYPLLSRALLA